MHWDAQAEPLPASPSTSPHLIQVTKLHANLDMYTEPSGHPRAQSTNTHADIEAVRYTLLHSSSAGTSLFSEHPVLRSTPGAFRPLLGHPVPPRQDKTNILGPRVKINIAEKVFLYPWNPFPSHNPPPSLCLLLWPGRHAGQTCSECASVIG